MSAVASILAKGFLLGWSVAWPPGPINAEMLRRGLAKDRPHPFWSAFSLGLGASSGDAVWALLVAFGAGTVVNVPGVRAVLGAVSFVLLLLLAWLFLRGALHAYRAVREGRPHAPPISARFEGARGGYLLGVTLAFSSPWNVAFWLAVIGQQATGGATLTASLLLAAAVISGAVTWCLVFNLALRAGARFATPRWEIATNAATGALMLYFAARLALRLL